MKRSTYAVLFCVSNFVSHIALLWLLAGKISTGVAERLPEKNAASYMLDAFAIVLAGSWWQIVKPRGNAHRGLSMTTVTMMVRLSRLAMLVALSRFVLPLMTTRVWMFSSKPDFSETVSWFGLAYVATTVTQLARVFLKHAMPTAEEVMMNDSRKPVLYLRSFEKELQKAPRLLKQTGVVRNFTRSAGGYYSGRTAFDEQIVFAQALERIGPYIAIGRPSEGYQDMDLGAAKKFVADDEWQTVVCQWLKECAAVVLEGGDSAGLGWEIDQVVLLVAPQRVLVMCPYTHEEYHSFVQAPTGAS